MKPIYRWIFCHQKLTKAILAVLVTTFCFLVLDPETFSFGLRFLVIFSLLFSCYNFVGSTSDLLLREPLEILEQNCDPYPLLEEVALHMRKLPEGFHGQMTQINYAMALVQTGDYDKALETLEAIDIEQMPNPYAKFIYYNNLCDLMTRLNRYPEADNWYAKTQEILDGLPNNRMKSRLDRTVEMNAIEARFRDQDYVGALRRLAKIPCPTPRSVAEAALLAARCNIALEEYDKAKEKLHYILDNGNRLHCVTEARELLEKLN